MAAESAMRVETKQEAQEPLEDGFDRAAVETALRSRQRKKSRPAIALDTGRVIEGRARAKERITKSIERIPSGIPGLDDETEGGFIKNSVNLVSGSPGAGKTIFAVQFLIEGMRNGESTLFITFEETKSNVYKYMAKLGWDLERLEDEKKFFFLRYSPSQVYKLLEEGGGTIENLIKQYDVKRIAIDSITAFTLLYKDDLAIREALLSLFNLINEWNCTTILTAEQESDPDKHRPTVIEFEVDSVILLYNFRTNQNVRQRVAEILKMRGTDFAQRIFPMRIDSEGIKFFPHEMSF